MTSRPNSYSPALFERLAAESVFPTCQISTDGIGLEVRLTKGEGAGEAGSPAATGSRPL